MLCRFVQADSFVPSMGDSRARDRYVYVKKNPVKFIDPSGHVLDPGGVVPPYGRLSIPTLIRPAFELDPTSGFSLYYIHER